MVHRSSHELSHVTLGQATAIQQTYHQETRIDRNDIDHIDPQHRFGELSDTGDQLRELLPGALPGSFRGGTCSRGGEASCEAPPGIATHLPAPTAFSASGDVRSGDDDRDDLPLVRRYSPEAVRHSALLAACVGVSADISLWPYHVRQLVRPCR